MSLGTAQLTESLQMLIDARLDTIDRMLLGRVPRQDRLAIVREVESQVFELLHEREAGELSRDDVLAVLARLDPPEAYLPETEEETTSPRAPARSSTRVPTTQPKGHSTAARVSGILGLVCLTMVILSPLIFFIGEASGSEVFAMVLWFGGDALTIIAGVLGIALGIVGRRSGTWAFVGIVTSALAVCFGFVVAILLMLEFVG